MEKVYQVTLSVSELSALINTIYVMYIVYLCCSVITK